MTSRSTHGLNSVSIMLFLIFCVSLAGCGDRDNNTRQEEHVEILATPEYDQTQPSEDILAIDPLDVTPDTSTNDMAEMPPTGLTIPGADKAHQKEIEELLKENTMTLEDVEAVFYFGFDKAALSPDARTELMALIPQLKAMPGTIMIEGHADKRGSRDYNKTLGMRRAQAVADILEEQGVEKNRIQLTSYGSERPLSRSNDEQSHSKNRRAELFVTSAGK